MVTTDRRVITAVLVLVLSVAAAYIWWSSGSQESEPGTKVDEWAMDIEIDGLNKTRFVLSEHRGEVVVVEFMTTWCGFCERQHEVLKKLWEEVDDVYIASIDVDVNLPISELEKWVAAKGVHWFHGHSPEAGVIYKVSGVPTVIVIDKDGVIRYRGHFTPFDKLQLLIKQLQ